MAEVQTGSYSITEQERTANTIPFSQWDVQIYDTDLTRKLMRINATGDSFTINYPTIFVKRSTNVGDKNQAAANFYSTLKDPDGTVLWNVPQRLPADSSNYTWTTKLTQGTQIQVYRRKDVTSANKTYSTRTYFNSDNSTTRTVKFSWTVQLQAGSSSNQKTAGLHSRNSSISQHSWTNGTKLTTWDVPVTLYAAPTFGTTTATVMAPKSGSSGYAGLSKTRVAVTANAQYGGYIKSMTISVGNASQTLNWASGTSRTVSVDLTPTNTGSLPVSISITDSRGQTNSKTLSNVSYVAKTAPTISNVAFSPVSNSGNAMNGYFKGLSKLKAVVTAASTITSGSISNITVTATGATGGAGQGPTITTGILQTAGTINPVVTVQDSYQMTATKNNQSITVVTPTVSANGLNSKRIGPSVTDPDHDRTYNDEGVEAVLKVTLSHTLITESNNHINMYSAPTIVIKNGNTTITDYDITWYDTYTESTGVFSNATNWNSRSSSASITVYAYIRGKNNFTFDKDTTYVVSLTPNSTYGTGATVSGSIVPAFYLLAGRAGGKGLGIGRKPPTDALYVNMDSYLQKKTIMSEDGIYYEGTNNTTQMIRFLDNTVDQWGNGMVIGGGASAAGNAGGLVIVGAGESPNNVQVGLYNEGYAAGSELLALTSDATIYFFTGANGGYASAKQSWIDSSGNLHLAGSINSKRAVLTSYKSVAITATGKTINLSTLTLPANGRYLVLSTVSTNKGATLTLYNAIVVTSGTATSEFGTTTRVTTSSGQGVSNWKYIVTEASSVTITLQAYSYSDGGTGHNMSGYLMAIPL